MQPRTLLLFLAGAVIGGLGWLTWHEQTHARAADVARQRISSQIVATQSDVEKSSRRLAAAKQTVLERRAELEKLRGDKVAAPAPAVRRSNSILELIRNDPEAEVLYLESRRAQLTATYGPLYRSLHLTPEAVQKFEAAFVKREATRMDLGAIAERGGGPIGKLSADAEKEYADAQRALLGEEGYRRLSEYENLAPWRSLVGAIAGVAAVEHMPFTPEQADALVAVFAVARRPEKPVLAGLQRSSASGIDWDAVDAAAQKILSPAQFEVMRTMDPGPTHGGILQNRFYARVTIADEEEARKAVPTAKSGGG